MKCPKCGHDIIRTVNIEPRRFKCMKCYHNFSQRSDNAKVESKKRDVPMPNVRVDDDCQEHSDEGKRIDPEGKGLPEVPDSDRDSGKADSEKKKGRKSKVVPTGGKES